MEIILRIIRLLSFGVVIACTHLDYGTNEEGPARRGTDTSAEPEPNVEITCPKSLPSAGDPCETVGLRCAYGDIDRNFICNNDFVFMERIFVSRQDSDESLTILPDAGSNESVSCTGMLPDRCTHIQCQMFCCVGDGDENGCAGCCGDKFCSSIPPEECPRNRCRVALNCIGEAFCNDPVRDNNDLPCGVVGYSGTMPCCDGLVRRCAAAFYDGNCISRGDPGWEIFADRPPECIACGDGICELFTESPCNCPEDCDA